MKFHIDTTSKVPIYRQLTGSIESAVKSGRLHPGEQLPSMNQIADRHGISRETVKKAYTILCRKGALVSKQGKGFYVAEKNADSMLQVLVLFDKFSVYKQVIFNSLAQALGGRADITLHTHNQSIELLEYYLDNNLDNFDYYVVTPHFPLDEATLEKSVKLISRIPNRKLIMLDRWIKEIPGNYGAVFQDFENDIYEGLREGLDKILESGRMRVITLPESLYGCCIHHGLERFATDYKIRLDYYTEVPEDIAKGDIFLVLNSQLDWGLAALARKAAEKRLSPGRDISIISYNDFELNDVVLGGLTTVSTDFAKMGRLAAEMILTGKPSKIHCPFHMNHRRTF